MHPEDRVESFASAPYPLAGDVRLGGVWLSDAIAHVTFVDQHYDFACGELITRLRYVIDGQVLHLEILTFCPRSLPTIVAQEIRARVAQPCEISLRSAIDPTGVPGSCLVRETVTPGESLPVVDGSLRWASLGNVTTCGEAYKTELLGASEPDRQVNDHDIAAPLSTTYTFNAQSGQTVILRQLTALVPSVMHTEPEREAVRLIHLASQRGFEMLRAQSHDAWRDLWRGRVNLLGADTRWQAMADAAFFYLHASTHPSSISSTSLFGLAD